MKEKLADWIGHTVEIEFVEQERKLNPSSDDGVPSVVGKLYAVDDIGIVAIDVQRNVEHCYTWHVIAHVKLKG